MRQSIKAEAKMQFMAQYWPCVGVQSVMLLIPLLLSWITGKTTDPLSIQEVLFTDFAAAIRQFLGFTLLTLLIALLTGTVSVEVSYFFLRVYRGERVCVNDFFSNLFIGVGRKAGVNLWMALFLFVWGMVFLLPGVLVMVFAFYSMRFFDVANVLFVFLAFAGGVLMIVKSLAYSMMPYIIRDCPQVTVRQSMRQSIFLMRGRKSELFLLMISFFGWTLLSALSFGILSFFFVGPYLSAALAGFYHHIMKDTAN